MQTKPRGVIEVRRRHYFDAGDLREFGWVVLPEMREAGTTQIRLGPRVLSYFHKNMIVYDGPFRRTRIVSLPSSGRCEPGRGALEAANGQAAPLRIQQILTA